MREINNGVELCLSHAILLTYAKVFINDIETLIFGENFFRFVHMLNKMKI